MSKDASHAIKTDWGTYLAILIVFSPLIILSIVRDASVGVQLCIWVVVAVIFFWLDRYAIFLDAGGLTYRTMTSRTKVSYEDIKKAHIDIRISNDAKGMYRLHLKNAHDVDLVTINIQPFSKRDVTYLLNIIAKENHTIDFDRYCKSIQEKNFKPISILNNPRLFKQAIIYMAVAGLVMEIFRYIRYSW